MTRVLVAVIAALAAFIAVPAVSVACTSDNECKGDRVCNAGACVAPAAPAACTSDKDCPGDLVCNAQRCTAAGIVPAPPAPPRVTQAAPMLGAAMAPAPAGVHVSFAPVANASYQVSVETAAGIRQCIAPCTLPVEPGARRVQISGDASFTQVIEVPAGGGAFTVQHAPASRKRLWWIMTVGGAGMTALGFYGFNQKNTPLAVVGLAGGGPICIAGVLGLLTGDKGRGENAIRPRTTAARTRRSSIALEGLVMAPVDSGVTAGAGFSF